MAHLGRGSCFRTLKKKTAAELAEQFKRHDVLAILADKSRIRHHGMSISKLFISLGVIAITVVQTVLPLGIFDN